MIIHLAALIALNIAHSDYRFTCVSPDGQSLLIENPSNHQSGHVYRVNLPKTMLAQCRAGTTPGALAWDTFRETPARLSKKDPNDVIFHFISQELLPACDPNRHPLPMASHIEYGESCFHAVTHDIRIDMANPLDSELTMRNTFKETASVTKISCYPGYSRDLAALLEVTAQRNCSGNGR